MFHKIDAWFENLLKQKTLLWILGIALILRIPSLFEPYWYGDEAIYLTLGEGIRQGKLLYRDIFDHKPPAIYLLAALAGSLFWFKWILLVWQTATIILFWNFCKTLFAADSFPGKNITRAATLATIVFALLTTLPTLEGNIVNAELLMVGPILGGFILLWKFKHRAGTLWWSGLLFSLGALFKIPALFEISAIVIYWLILSIGNWKEFIKSISKSVVLGIVILIPFLLFALHYLLNGAVVYYVQGVLSQNFGYVASWSVPSLASSADFAIGLPQRAIILALALLIVFLVRKLFDNPDKNHKVTLFTAIWLLVTMFAVLLSGRPYPHYIIQVVAPASIALAILAFGRERYRFLTVPIMLLLLFSLNFYQFSHYQILPYYKNFLNYTLGQTTQEEYFLQFDKKTPGTYLLANYLTSNTKKTDSVFIWGTMPELYALSRRLPPGRYTVAFHITGFGGEKETIASLQKNPPRYIIRNLDDISVLPGLDSLLQNEYFLTEVIANFELWRHVNIKKTYNFHYQ